MTTNSASGFSRSVLRCMTIGHHRRFDQICWQSCVIACWITVYMWPVLRVATVRISLSLLSIPLISPRMVNYHDPVVVARDYCASTFAAKQASSWSRLTSFDSGIIEVLACFGWTLLVCLPCRSWPLLSHSVSNHPVFHFQLGVSHYSRLRVECLPKASPLPLDDMGG